MRSRNFARCKGCGEERRFLERGDLGVLFGPPWLCVRCYFNYVRQRAKSSVVFDQVSAEEVRAKVAIITAAYDCFPDDETEKERCIRLLALEQLQMFLDSKNVRVAIADDLGLRPERLFPRTLEDAGGYDDRKDVIIAQVREVRTRNEGDLRASLMAKAIFLALGIIVAVVLYRAWK